MTMLKFPEVDIAGSYDLAESLVALNSFNTLHTQAEASSDLFVVGHAIVRAAVTAHAIDNRVEDAILVGVSAYEIFGSVVLGHDDLKMYRRDDMMNASGGSNGIVEMFDSLEEAYRGLESVPELREAIRLLSVQGLRDSGVGLVEHALYGAAILRDLQLELNNLRLLREEIDRIFD